MTTTYTCPVCSEDIGGYQNALIHVKVEHGYGEIILGGAGEDTVILPRTVRNPTDWWMLYNASLPDILAIAETHLGIDLTSKVWSDDVMNVAGFSSKSKEVEHELSFGEILKTAEKRGDWEGAHALLNLMWNAAPDEPGIHSWPSWSHLCDLCSEIWVFHEGVITDDAANNRADD